ncbi:hypothetical protein HZS_1385 [Henneguya salminicola]|nr:hypothetical protein HZS_1385 [Henneguya salminicola]
MFYSVVSGKQFEFNKYLPISGDNVFSKYLYHGIASFAMFNILITFFIHDLVYLVIKIKKKSSQLKILLQSTIYTFVPCAIITIGFSGAMCYFHASDPPNTFPFVPFIIFVSIEYSILILFFSIFCSMKCFDISIEETHKDSKILIITHHVFFQILSIIHFIFSSNCNPYKEIKATHVTISSISLFLLEVREVCREKSPFTRNIKKPSTVEHITHEKCSFNKIEALCDKDMVLDINDCTKTPKKRTLNTFYTTHTPASIQKL